MRAAQATVPWFMTSAPWYLLGGESGFFLSRLLSVEWREKGSIGPVRGPVPCPTAVSYSPHGVGTPWAGKPSATARGQLRPASAEQRWRADGRRVAINKQGLFGGAGGHPGGESGGAPH